MFGIAAFHILATWINSAPANLITIDKDDFFHAYFGNTLVAQNWAFFAPTPVDADIELYVRGRAPNGKVSEWVNISRAIVADVQNNRLSQYEFVATSVMNAVNSAEPALARRAINGGTEDVMLMPDVRPLYRIGASILSHIYPTIPFAELQMAIAHYEFPRFSRRSIVESNPHTTLRALDWKPFPLEVDSTIWR